MFQVFSRNVKTAVPQVLEQLGSGYDECMWGIMHGKGKKVYAMHS